MSDGDATAPLTGRAEERVPVGDAAFAEGDLIADRYRVVRFIASGGMGEVYEVRDVELRGAVALKVIRADIAASAAAIERFKREINLARQITHPNVSRIFDLGKHGDITFLTMELIRGEPLSARGSAPMPRAELLAVLRDIASAIAAAHARGIVHRDLKPGNVMIDAGPPRRAVVTDFGIAFAEREGHAGDVVGSPAYMAPEQRTGGDVSARADVYALGVIAYELATGTRPFADDAAIGAVPVAPRERAPELPRSWNDAILRALAREPAARFATAGDFVAALEPHRRRWPIAMVVAAVVLAGGVAAWRYARHPVAVAVTNAPIAILGFDNTSHRPDAAWLSTAIAETLSNELLADNRVRVVPGEVVARAKLELGIADSAAHPTDVLARIRTRLGCDYVIAGAYSALGDDRIRLDVRIEDAGRGTTIASFTRTGSETKLVELVEVVGTQVRDELGVPALTAAQTTAVRAALPSRPEVARKYADGVAKLRAGDPLGARGDLESAIVLDPGHPMIHAALSSVWLALGYDARAATEAQRAYESRGSLGELDQRTIEARYRQTRHEWDDAIAIYTTQLREQPDNLERGLRLVAAEIDAARGTEALATIAELRRVLAPAALDPNLDLHESRAAMLVGDQQRTLAAALHGIDHAQALGARELAIEGWIYRANGEWALGRYDDASKSVNRALELLRDLPDDLQRARALATLASIAGDRGDKPEAKRRYEEALAVFRKIGNQQGIAVVLNNMAADQLDIGDLDGANAGMLEVVAVAREIGDRKLLGFGALNLGEIARERGELAEARQRIDEQLANARDRGDREATADGVFQRGLYALASGDITAAITDIEDATTRHRELALDAQRGLDLVARGRAAMAAGDSAGADKWFDEAITIDRTVGRKWEEWNAIAWRSYAWLAAGRAEAADTALRELGAALSPDATDLAGFVHAGRAWALAALGRHADAESERALAKPSPRASRRYAAALALARSLALDGKTAAAIAAFEAARADADHRGFHGVVREADAELARLRRR